MYYNDLKKHWSDQFRLSANKVFADFLYYLERGGKAAEKFIEANTALVETVAGGPDELEAILDAIDNDMEAAENQAYFFTVAEKTLPKVRTLLARKYEASIRYAEQLGINAGEFNAETLLPGVRKMEEDGGDAIPDPDNEGKKSPEINPIPDNTPDSEPKNVETVQEEIAQDNDNAGEFNAETVAASPEDETAASEDELATETDAEIVEPTEAPSAPEESVSNAEDDLKAKINTLLGDGASKSEIWAAVSEMAGPLGWGAKRVWAYVDEIAPQN